MVTKADAGRMATLATVNQRHRRRSQESMKDDKDAGALPCYLPDEQDVPMQLWRRNNHSEGGFLKLGL